MLRDVFATLDDLNPSTLVASQGLQNFRINDNRDLPYSLYGPFPGFRDPYAAAAHREHPSAVRGKERPPVLVAQRRYFEVEPRLFAVQGQDDVVEADEEVNVVLVSAG